MKTELVIWGVLIGLVLYAIVKFWPG